MFKLAFISALSIGLLNGHGAWAAHCGSFLHLEEPRAKRRYLVRPLVGDQIEAVRFDRSQKLVFLDHGEIADVWDAPREDVRSALKRILLPFLTTTDEMSRQFKVAGRFDVEDGKRRFWVNSADFRIPKSLFHLAGPSVLTEMLESAVGGKLVRLSSTRVRLGRDRNLMFVDARWPSVKWDSRNDRLVYRLLKHLEPFVMSGEAYSEPIRVSGQFEMVDGQRKFVLTGATL